MWKNVFSNWGLLSKNSCVGKLDLCSQLLAERTRRPLITTARIVLCLKLTKQNAKCVCMLKIKHFLEGRHLNIQILKIHVRNPSEVNKYLNIIQHRRSVCFSEMHIQTIPKPQKCASRITVEFRCCFFLRASKEFLLG